MKPNIVLIVTDDQPRGLLDAMPMVDVHLRQQGLTLTSAFASSPLCGVARSTLLTGLSAYEHGVWSNTVADGGGWEKLQPLEGDTIATKLHDLGYHTALVGKYMNGYSSRGGGVPPGWDVFRSQDPDGGGDGSYYDFTMTGTGVPVHHGTDPWNYSTDVFAAEATDAINAAPPDQPLFLYFAPNAPHAEFYAAPRYKDTWPVTDEMPTGVNHVEGMSPWLQALTPVSEARVKRVIKDQHETVRAVDDAFLSILASLATTGRQDTLFVYLGDNGLQHGVHRLNGKYVPYDRATHLQVLVKWIGHVQGGGKLNEPVTLVDLHAMMMNAAVAEEYALPVHPDGVPLAGAVHGSRPAYIGWRTKRFMYCHYADGGREFYDYRADPHELSNVVDLPKHAGQVAEFEARAVAAGLPPGYPT